MRTLVFGLFFMTSLVANATSHRFEYDNLTYGFLPKKFEKALWKENAVFHDRIAEVLSRALTKKGDPLQYAYKRAVFAHYIDEVLEGFTVRFGNGQNVYFPAPLRTSPTHMIRYLIDIFDNEALLTSKPAIRHRARLLRKGIAEIIEQTDDPEAKRELTALISEHAPLKELSSDTAEAFNTIRAIEGRLEMLFLERRLPRSVNMTQLLITVEREALKPPPLRSETPKPGTLSAICNAMLAVLVPSGS